MEIKEVCVNCEGYSKCHDGEDYSTDCDGGFMLRSDIVKLQCHIKELWFAIATHKAETTYYNGFKGNGEANEKLWEVLKCTM